MRVDDLPFLQSAAGRVHLAELAAEPLTDATHLQWAMRLRQTLSAENTHALLETALLRQKATAKFSRADQMFFTRHGLEMSSAESVSRYRAQRFGDMAHVADLACGIGGDALGLIAHSHVTGIDIDPLHVALAAANVAAYGKAAQFTPLVADLLALAPFSADAVFFDPARRDERGRRIRSVYAYRPPLSLLDRWRTVTPHAGVKISPGVDYAELPPDAEVEFVSVHGELREAVLWFGGLRTGVARRATLLNRAGEVVGGLTTGDDSAEIAVADPRAYLYEPDAAVIRSHLVEALAVQLDATKLDDTIAYLTADVAHDTPLATRYRVDDWFPFQLKRLRSYLRERGIGRLTIKKRGSPLDPDQLRHQLRPRGDDSATLFLTQLRGAPIVIVADCTRE